MFGIANTNCPMCRSNDIARLWVNGNSFLQCQTCGERWK